MESGYTPPDDFINMVKGIRIELKSCRCCGGDHDTYDMKERNGIWKYVCVGLDESGEFWPGFPNKKGNKVRSKHNAEKRFAWKILKPEDKRDAARRILENKAKDEEVNSKQDEESTEEINQVELAPDDDYDDYDEHDDYEGSDDYEESDYSESYSMYTVRVGGYY